MTIQDKVESVSCHAELMAFLNELGWPDEVVVPASVYWKWNNWFLSASRVVIGGRSALVCGSTCIFAAAARNTIDLSGLDPAYELVLVPRKELEKLRGERIDHARENQPGNLPT